MNIRAGKIALHLARIVSITALIVLCMVYPFLPGGYDGLAVALSAMAQVFSVFGLLLVPIGIVWLAYEFWRQTRNKRNLPVKTRGYTLSIVAVIAASLVAVVVSIAGAASIGLSFGLMTLVLWAYVVFRLIPNIRALKSAELYDFNDTGLYLAVIPIAALFLQLTLAAPITQFSRDHAIAMSVEIVNAIEAYRAANGHYPNSLLATWADYSPNVVGIEQFHYERQGDAYNLVFQQPRFLLDDFGVREFVIYNPLGEHRMISHASWILLLSPEELRRSQGWYAVRDASSLNWRYFWFD